MRALLVLFVATVSAGSANSGRSPVLAPTGITLKPASDPAMTEGEVVIDGEPAQVFAIAQDYRRWTELMPDVAKVEIHEQKGVDAMVTLVAPSGHRDNLHFHNQPAANLIFFEDTGNNGRADVWAEIVFAPAEQPSSTRVHIRLYAKLHGLATLVASESEVRDQREHKIVADLTHIRDYFRRRVADR
jgi:uncharacterized membrane protein